MDPVKFLIVDDLDENILALGAVLKREGLQLLCAKSAPDALEHLLNHDVALAIVDVQMPEMDGFELAELMRGTERTRRIPIIFLTAGSIDERRRFRGYESGAVDFLFKPVEPQVLKSKTDVFFELYRQRQELSRQRDILSDYKNRLELAMRAGRTGVWDWEIATSRLILSDESYSVFGIDRGSFGNTLNDMLKLVHQDDRDRMFAAMSDALARGADYTDEFRIGQEDGQSRRVKSMGMIRRDKGGRIVSMVGTVTDVSEQRAAEAQLARAKEAAEAANAAKDRFLAVLSHELRTPLAPVLVTLSLWEQNESLPQQLRQDLNMIRRNVELECRLIDDMLDVNRIARGKLVLKRDRVDMHDEIRHAVQNCSAEAAAKRIALKIKLNAVECAVTGDAARLQQILWNLLKNAVKFTPAEGTVEINTSNSSAGKLRVEVQDSGIGIDPKSIGTIFHAFEQGGSEITQRFGGLGLGLAISKALVEMHGGTLVASSAGLGQGATFMIELALAEDVAAINDPGEQAPPIIDASRRLSLLLVEDHEDTASIMQRVLEDAGYDVSVAVTIEQAICTWRKGQFDLLISDLGLPDGSGRDLMRQIRSEGPALGIALTGFGMDEDVRSGNEAGFSAHLTKPVDFENLLRTIARVVRQNESNAVAD